MNNAGKILYWVGVYAVVAYGGYYLYTNSKNYLAKQVILLGGTKGTLDNVKSGFDTPFLKAWVKGLKAKTTEFNYNGMRFRTVGGTKIV